MQSLEPFLLQLRDDVALEGVRRDVGQRTTRPEAQRPSHQLGFTREITGRAGPAHQVAEFQDVELVGGYRDQVAVLLGPDRGRVTQRGPQPAQVNLQSTPRIRGLGTTPQPIDQLFGRYHPVGRRQQRGQ